MSQANIDIVRAFMDAGFRLDLDTVFSLCDPEIEFRPPAEGPDFEVAHGIEEMIESHRLWYETWETLHFDAPEYTDAGDRVLVTYRQRGKGKGAGVEVETEVFDVVTVGAGKVVRYEKFFNRGPALEAAGLSEDARAST
jgi:ketosteroid isomerase-like protein